MSHPARVAAVPAAGLLSAAAAAVLRYAAARLLFDTVLNLRGRAGSALVSNAAALGADLAALDAVVISHLHMDHAGATPGN